MFDLEQCYRTIQKAQDKIKKLEVNCNREEDCYNIKYQELVISNNKRTIINYLQNNLNIFIKEIKRGKSFVVSILDNRQIRRIAIIKSPKGDLGSINIGTPGISYIYYLEDLDDENKIIKDLRFNFKLQIIDLWE